MSVIDFIVYFIGRSLFIPLFGLCYRARAYGKKHIPKGGALIASNHASFLDPPLIGYKIYPRRLCYLARDSLFKPIFGWFLRRIWCYPIKRGKGNAALFKLIPDLTSKGKLVVVFPEGTRTPDGEIQPGQAGIALLVQRTTAPVVPCYVHGTYDAWGKGKRMKLWGKVAVVFGSPLDFSYLEGRDKKEAQQEIVRMIMEKIVGLKQWYLDGATGSPP